MDSLDCLGHKTHEGQLYIQDPITVGIHHLGITYLKVIGVFVLAPAIQMHVPMKPVLRRVSYCETKEGNEASVAFILSITHTIRRRVANEHHPSTSSKEPVEIEFYRRGSCSESHL